MSSAIGEALNSLNSRVIEWKCQNAWKCMKTFPDKPKNEEPSKQNVRAEFLIAVLSRTSSTIITARSVLLNICYGDAYLQGQEPYSKCEFFHWEENYVSSLSELTTCYVIAPCLWKTLNKSAKVRTMSSVMVQITLSSSKRKKNKYSTQKKSAEKSTSSYVPHQCRTLKVFFKLLS